MGIQINGQTDIVTSTTVGGRVTIPTATFPSVSNINATGVSTFSGGIIVSAGSTAAPSISPLGNSNIGIFFPSTNTTAVSYGGTEALRIDSSGRLGIGTNPGALTHLYGSGGELLRLQKASSANNNYILYKTDTGTDQCYLGFSDTGVDDFAIYNVRNGYIRFATNNIERMRIPSGGGLSVGTVTSPNAVDQKTAIRIGSLNVSLTTITNLTTTWTDISVAAGANGLAFVDVYNTTGGAQGNFLVSWRGYPANATVISSNNGTGLTINFQVSGSKLQMQTTSGTVSGGAYIWAG